MLNLYYTAYDQPLGHRPLSHADDADDDDCVIILPDDPSLYLCFL